VGHADNSVTLSRDTNILGKAQSAGNAKAAIFNAEMFDSDAKMPHRAALLSLLESGKCSVAPDYNRL